MTIDRIFIGKAAKNGLEDGGPGSGNFGHKGRPGLVGGSGKGGGKAYRTASSESASGYVGVQRAKEFRGIADSARKQKTAAGFIKSLTPAQRTQIDNQRQSCGTQESFDQYAERLHRLMSGRPLTTVPTPPKHVVAQGQNIEGKWKRNAAFQHEINDVIHAQGFDGLPQVVGREEFDAAVKASKFIAQRSYTGQNLDEANQFRDQLFHGDWYVSCTNGGAQYGQGMYCAADYTGTLSDGIKEEMRHYRAQWQGMLGGSRSQEVAAQDAYNKAWAEGIGEVMTVPDIRPRYFIRAFGIDDSFFVNNLNNITKAKMWIKQHPEAAEKMREDLQTLVDNCNNARDQILNMTPKEYKAFSKRDTPTSYTETFTLTPDAKVVKYDDIWKEYEQYSKQYSFEDMVNQSTDSVLKELFDDELDRKEYKEMLRLYSHGTTKRQKDKLRLLAELNGIDPDNGYEELYEIAAKIEMRYDEYRANYVHNVGSFAAMRGYDAINAEGHGESDSYTVILNRTKCIFLDPKESYEEAA